jgi:hypothetical protein
VQIASGSRARKHQPLGAPPAEQPFSDNTNNLTDISTSATWEDNIPTNKLIDVDNPSLPTSEGEYINQGAETLEMDIEMDIPGFEKDIDIDMTEEDNHKEENNEQERTPLENAIDTAESAAADQNTIEDNAEDESEEGAVVDEEECESADDRPLLTKDPTYMIIDRVVAAAALADLGLHLKPKRNVKGNRYTDPGFDSLTRNRLENMKMFLMLYVDPVHGKPWMDASLHIANLVGRGSYFARKLREWTRNYIDDRTCLPVNVYGTWSESLLDHEDLRQELNMHLQSVGKYVTANNLMEYMARTDVKQRWKTKRDISHSTAKRWMHELGYRWTFQPGGQYVDGHERLDVVNYRQNVFLPAMNEIEFKIRAWKNGTDEEFKPWPHDVDDGPRPFQDRTVIWFHDESTFYANDRRKVGWVHKDAKAVPRAKGEGASLMVADFISADYGWLQSPSNPKIAARVLFKAGIDRQGYFDNKSILEQTRTAMDILETERADESHVFVFDNATTHTKRADDALSARKMPKNIPKEGNFLVERNKVGPDGKVMYGTDRKALKEKVKMANGHFADGTTQEFYFPEGHEHAGVFKGMAIILEERGYTGCVGTKGKKAECPKFKCAPGATDCCCRRLLYNEPDFANVPSLLEIECSARGFRVIFLPKFHCELNFIEQCWGYAKRTYRKFPASSKEADLEMNVINALASVPLTSMRR